MGENLAVVVSSLSIRCRGKQVAREGPFRLHESITYQENKFPPHPAIEWILCKDIKGVPITKNMMIPNHYMKNEQGSLSNSLWFVGPAFP